ncbi:MAG TPA: crossover junction endodeoxyribonuclease RuvC [Nitrospirota bacterium]|jgi:crossover junction endodeoxyribonuclease RuvC|nr:crossover junction endodeoxyribonuclease RuvC [Nitrospirota bacterium]
MRVLGIDPGTLTSGYGIVAEENHKLFHVASGGISPSAKQPFPKRLKKIYEELEKIIEKYRPHVVVVEDLFVSKNIKSALKLGHARGVAILAAMNAGLPVFEYAPLEVKQAVVGHGKAEKKQVQLMVKTLLDLQKVPHPADAADALAAAICHIHSSRLREILKSPSYLRQQGRGLGTTKGSVVRRTQAG